MPWRGYISISERKWLSIFTSPCDTWRCTGHLGSKPIEAFWSASVDVAAAAAAAAACWQWWCGWGWWWRGGGGMQVQVWNPGPGCTSHRAERAPWKGQRSKQQLEGHVTTVFSLHFEVTVCQGLPVYWITQDSLIWCLQILYVFFGTCGFGAELWEIVWTGGSVGPEHRTQSQSGARHPSGRGSRTWAWQEPQGDDGNGMPGACCNWMYSKNMQKHIIWIMWIMCTYECISLRWIKQSSFR